MAGNHQGHGHHAASRRGAGPHRRVRCGKIHRGPGSHGLRASRVPHQRRLHRLRRHGSDGRQRRGKTQAARRENRLCGAKCRRVIQPGTQADRSIRRDTRQARQEHQGRGGSRCKGPLRAAVASRSRRHRLSLSPPGIGRAAAARDDGHGLVLPPGSHHLRRADHGPRCHDPDRSAGHHSRHRRSIPDGSHLHYPRPGRGGADVRQDHGSSTG